MHIKEAPTFNSRKAHSFGIQFRIKLDRQCIVEDCTNEAKFKDANGIGMCEVHFHGLTIRESNEEWR